MYCCYKFLQKNNGPKQPFDESANNMESETEGNIDKNNKAAKPKT